MLRYHLATTRGMASRLSVYSHQKGLSAIQRKIPSLITLLKITRTEWPRRLETRLNFFFDYIRFLITAYLLLRQSLKIA